MISVWLISANLPDVAPERKKKKEHKDLPDEMPPDAFRRLLETGGAAHHLIGSPSYM
jgi:hypothetical protein